MMLNRESVKCYEEKKIFISILLVSIIVIIGIVIGVMLEFKESNKIIGRYLTYEHYRYSSVVLNNNIYFPSSFKEEDIKEYKTLGILGSKDKGWFVDSFASTGAIIIDNKDEEVSTFKVIDDFPMSYVKGDYLADIKIARENITKYDKFVLCNDSNTYKDDSEIRLPIDKEYLIKLIEEFGQVKISIDDYNTADDRFYIYVDSPDNKIHERTFDKPIVYIGTIFMKNNKYYYGNLENEIKGQLYDIFIEKYCNIVQINN